MDESGAAKAYSSLTDVKIHLVCLVLDEMGRPDSTVEAALSPEPATRSSP